MKNYLKPSEIIDFDSSLEIMLLSRKLAKEARDEVGFVKSAYEFVRDEIDHSADIEGAVVTCKASEVLREGQGICFSKSHLLAALLRCNGVPTGFCYQRLILDDIWFPHLVLHGLNAVFIQNEWLRLDARGNKPGVYAQFSLEKEILAFPIREEKGEEDIPLNFARPDKNVINALAAYKDFRTLWQNLPRELAEAANIL